MAETHWKENYLAVLWQNKKTKQISLQGCQSGNFCKQHIHMSMFLKQINKMSTDVRDAHTDYAPAISGLTAYSQHEIF